MSAVLAFGRTASSEELAQARRLHARIYAERGLIERLPESGVIEDIWSPHSSFFVATENRRVVGTCRAIRWTGTASLPTVDVFNLDLDGLKLREAAMAGRITEISALATDPSAQHAELLAAGLYRTMFQADATSDCSDKWIFSIEEWLFRAFRDHFHFSVAQVGDGRHYYGEICIPVVLDLSESRRSMEAAKPALLAWFLDESET